MSNINNYQDIKKLKTKIYRCLESNPETRNSDIKLTNMIWINYYPQYLKVFEGKIVVSIVDLYNLPTQDDVKRIRAKIQNPNPKKGYKGKFFPTDWEIAKKRHWKQENWRSLLEYSPELRTIEQEHINNLEPAELAQIGAL